MGGDVGVGVKYQQVSVLGGTGFNGSLIGARERERGPVGIGVGATPRALRISSTCDA
jgi:DNA topoisomerase VI subunit B